MNPSSNTGTKRDYQTPCTDAEDRIQNQSKIKHLRCRGIAEAIDHYHTVLTRPEYFWEYRWSLQEFLRSDENVEKFLNTAYLKGLRKRISASGGCAYCKNEWITTCERHCGKPSGCR